ncbi:MAG: hypothetical protein NC401_13920 [Ruminococcus sp.]|nr:hypothetical protein [Ruminococcus sp.]
MKIEDVNKALMDGKIIRHTLRGETYRYRLSGVLTRYSPEKGWTYSLELRDLRADCITMAALEDCEVEE